MTLEKNRLSLDRPATYQIKVPGMIDVSQADWASGLKIAFEGQTHDLPVSILTGEFDQAALHGLLRRLYSMGLPLVSVICIERGGDEES